MSLITCIINISAMKNRFFQYLLQYYKTLKAWLNPQDWKEIPLIQNAMAFLTVSANCSYLCFMSSIFIFNFYFTLQDFHHDRAVIKYKPEHLAIASLFLTLQCHGVTVPNTGEDDGVAWFSVKKFIVSLNLFAIR